MGRAGRWIVGMALVMAMGGPGLLPIWAGEGPSETLRPGDVLPVAQPLLDGAVFYVHHPASLPEGWYATLDGYPVRLLENGLWVYGYPTAEGYRSTGCLVGTLDPGAVGIVPVVPPARRPEALPNVALVGRQPSVGTVFLPQVSSYAPSWLQNERFREVEAWRSTVDRMAVLCHPPVILAWRGERPAVVYAWSGADWLSLEPREGEDMDQLLARHLYTLSQLLHREAFAWTNADTALLAGQCSSWRYRWSGVLVLENR